MVSLSKNMYTGSLVLCFENYFRNGGKILVVETFFEEAGCQEEKCCTPVRGEEEGPKVLKN